MRFQGRAEFSLDAGSSLDVDLLSLLRTLGLCLRGLSWHLADSGRHGCKCDERREYACPEREYACPEVECHWISCRYVLLENDPCTGGFHVPKPKGRN